MRKQCVLGQVLRDLGASLIKTLTDLAKKQTRSLQKQT